MNMRYGLLAFAVPTGILTFAHDCDAQVFLTEEQALRSLFGNSRIDRQEKTLKDGDRQALIKATGLRFPESVFTVLVAEHDGKLLGYGLVMNEIGKSEPITFMVVVGPDHRVMDVLVMVFRESRGAEVRETRFLRQFKGKQAGDPIAVNNDIVNYSGATLSSKAIARGVKRALAVVKHFYPASKSSQAASPAFMLPALPLAGARGVYRQVRYLMGTLAEIRLEAASGAHASVAASAAFSEIRRLEKIFSAHDPESELSYVNRHAADVPVPVSADMWALARAAIRYSRATAGSVDVTVGPLVRDPKSSLSCVGSDKLLADPRRRTIRFTMPHMQMDFGGFAKGYAASRAAGVLHKWEISSALINLGGSSIVTMPGGCHWLVGIADPAEPQRYAAILIANPGTSISCSGTYERAHIFDPRTGERMSGSRSVVAITKSPLLGEVLSKTMLIRNAIEFPGREYLRLVAATAPGTSIESTLKETLIFTRRPPQRET